MQNGMRAWPRLLVAVLAWALVVPIGAAQSVEASPQRVRAGIEDRVPLDDVTGSEPAVTAPDAPSGVVATAANASASVSWTAPAHDGGRPVTAYTVTASPGGATVAVGGSEQSAAVTGLTNGTAYTFTVAATNAVGTGAPSAPSNAVTPTEPSNNKSFAPSAESDSSRLFAAETRSLPTPWTPLVPTTTPWPEYPRPQLVRPEWANLNGQWQFAGATSLADPPIGRNLPETVLVPFPVESSLSGIARHEHYMWYRRAFQVPTSWTGRRIHLNFDAVNWQAVVWVNGVQVGSHTGAYDPFSIDVTDRLRTGDNEVVVGVYSPVDTAGIPIGKQRIVPPNGFYYTAASGIWQTVWLEPRNAAHITRLDMTPDLAAGVLDVVVQGGGISGQTARVDVMAGGTVVSSTTGTVGARIRAPVPDARLWSPDSPYLYDLRVSLTGAGGGDSVTSYFGMRSIGTAVVNGVLRPVLNGNVVFHLGTLDQGYWPDGVYTAPTDAALRFDIEQQKALGFNTIRKHIKVEPARWYHWADRIGVMVWQDMPAVLPDIAMSTADKENFESELLRMIDSLRSTTSIVMWVPFNEGWSMFDPARIADMVKARDPSRLVNSNSGSNVVGFVDGGNGDVIDDHIYVGPGGTRPPSSTRFSALGEFGGIGMNVPGHEWKPGGGFSYVMVPDATALSRRYVETNSFLQGSVFGRGLSASVYTQPFDVESEVSGVFTYDRKVLKMNADHLRATHRAVVGSVATLAVGRLVSLQVTNPGRSDRYLRHNASLGVTHGVTPASDDTTRRDTTFWVRRGLADSSCFSFESRNVPGEYLRQSSYRIRRDPSDGTGAFNSDATFCARPGRAGVGYSFESHRHPGRFMRHVDAEVYVAANGGPNWFDVTNQWAADVSWRVADPWWRSEVDLPVDETRSLQVVTPGHTNRYLRHSDSLGSTEIVTASSSALLRQDATFTVRRGLADRTCYSLESHNYPGQYLRHDTYRLRIAPHRSSEAYANDATFCTKVGLMGSDVSLASYNLAGHYIRHQDGMVWVAAGVGPNVRDGGSFGPDATWRIAPAWTGASPDVRLDGRVFDAQFYLDLYPDLRAAYGPTNTGAAAVHWLAFGIREGRMGAPAFHSRSYLASYADLRAAFGAANHEQGLEHFLRHGIREGRRGSLVLDARNYLARYPDLTSAYGSTGYDGAVQHFHQWGIKEGRRGSSFFDPRWYLSANPDVAAAFGSTSYRQAIIHWLRFGRAEGRAGAP